MALSAGALNVITTVKYDLDLINAVNKMTFLFDPNWQGVNNTLPISFFYVKEFKEVMDTEISQKPLLFYNSQLQPNEDMVSGGLLGIVSDNMINKPKKYQMSIIIPRSVDIYMRQAMFNKRVNFSDLYGNTGLANLELVTSFYTEMLIALLKMLNSPVFSSMLEKLDIKKFISDSMTGGIDDSNKTSLDMMWENRTLLRMKYWNGWKFKYVAIENYTPSKHGDEDDFFEATLNVTELPILTTRKASTTSLSKILPTKLGQKLKTESISAFLDKLEYDGKIIEREK